MESTQIINTSKTSMQLCKGGVRDLTNTFSVYRRKSHSKVPKKSEQEFLRERFKPLNKKFGKQAKKEKVDEDNDEGRKSNLHLLSTVSDENELQIIEVNDGKINKDGYSSNLQHMATKASMDEDGEASSRFKDGKENLPPLYVDIQEEIVRNLAQVNTTFN
jgi:hypothetical protein